MQFGFLKQYSTVGMYLATTTPLLSGISEQLRVSCSASAMCCPTVDFVCRTIQKIENMLIKSAA
ncbi:hypothetical protein LDFHOB_06735 [Candidatus Electronema aureum]